jgi:hypothetical protein
MDHTNILEISASMGAAIGGWEFIKYMLNIRTNKRKERSEADKAKAEADKAEAEANSADFSVLRETVEFLQQQLKDKEERFANQTDRLRKVQDDYFELLKTDAQKDLELQRFRCVRPKCAQREPQNGY